MLSDHTVTISKRLIEQLIDAAQAVSDSHLTGTLSPGRDSVRIRRLLQASREIAVRTGASSIPTFRLEYANLTQFKIILREFWSPAAFTPDLVDSEFEEKYFFGQKVVDVIRPIAIVTHTEKTFQICDVGGRIIESDFEFFVYPGGRIGFFCAEANYVYKTLFKRSPVDFCEMLSTAL